MKICSRKVYINGRFLAQPQTGVQRFAREILSALDLILQNEQPETDCSFTCLIPEKSEGVSLPAWKKIQILPCGHFCGNMWEQLDLPYFSRDGLLVNLCNIGPVLHGNQIAVIHDASIFAIQQAYSFPFKLKYKTVYSVLGQTAKRILTVSQFSKSEMISYLGLRAERIGLISEGCDHILRIQSDDSVLNTPQIQRSPYLLMVGSSSPHKNLALVIQAFEQLSAPDLQLVIAGGAFPRVFQNANQIDPRAAVTLGYVTDAQLKSLYTHAIGLIFPSLYEGFGLPPLEAMACGCPVIASDHASIPEVCGDAALYFDPTRASDLVAKLRAFLSDPTLQVSLREKGLARAKSFTWQRAAEMLLISVFEVLK